MGQLVSHDAILAREHDLIHCCTSLEMSISLRTACSRYARDARSGAPYLDPCEHDCVRRRNAANSSGCRRVPGEDTVDEVAEQLDWLFRPRQGRDFAVDGTLDER